MANAPQMADLTFGRRLRIARMSARLTIEEVADRVESSRESWSAYENDRRPMPSDLLARFAEVCDVSADWLLFGATRAYLRGKPSHLHPVPDIELPAYDQLPLHLPVLT